LREREEERGKFWKKKVTIRNKAIKKCGLQQRKVEERIN
jgi:hypothetical protein